MYIGIPPIAVNDAFVEPSVANNYQEMLKIRESPGFLHILLWNTEIMALCLPCWFLQCIGLATLSPIYDNALREKPFGSNK